MYMCVFLCFYFFFCRGSGQEERPITSEFFLMIVVVVVIVVIGYRAVSIDHFVASEKFSDTIVYFCG